MKFFIRLLLFLLSFPLFAQSDLDSNQQKVYAYLYSKQYEKAKALLDEHFLHSPKTSQKIIGLVYLADYLSTYEEHQKIVNSLEEAEKLAANSYNELDRGYVYYGYARYYLSLKQWDPFLQSVNQAIEIFSQKNNENFILTQLYYLRLKYKTQNLLEEEIRQDCVLANKHALKSKNNILISFTYNNLAYYYKKEFDRTQNKVYLDSSTIAYQKTYEFSEKIEEPSSKKRSLIVYYLNHNINAPDKETTKLNENLNTYLKALDLTEGDSSLDDLRSYLFNNIGSTYDKLGNKQLAESYFLKAYAIQKENPNIISAYRLYTLKNLAIFYAFQSNFQKAYEFEQMAYELLNEENQKQFDSNTQALEILYQTEKKNLTISQLEEKNKNYTRQKFMLIGICILSVLGLLMVFFWLKSRLKYNRQKTEILEAEKKQAELILELEKKEKEQLKINQELLALRQEHLEKQALATSLHLDEKSKLLDELKGKLSDSGMNVHKLFKEDQTTETEFADLQRIIEEVHPSFYKKLNEKAQTKLTTLDLKYAAYIYLNMDNQQIVNVLKAEPNTVRTTKYRLKQKLGLGKEIDLHLFLQNLVE